ncbi:MAG: phosphomannose isomerase type II C-terminal cupin domain [Rhodospirillales bacterium]|nr:phosphomannose isomerase type II C-terminal cupin domain [Alphaproteobacteria bacterium]USO04276.1 MAG: phosphomannose isomerase type II C-terminal cupin domain [Rhodospirillales bacterium]
MNLKFSDYKTGDSDTRPWGKYVVTNVGVTESGEDFCEKEITVHPGELLSLQSHELRREHWRVKEGTLTVIRDRKRITLEAGQDIEIAVRSIHCMANLGEVACVVHERQEGICREDDIVRYRDAYDRSAGTAESEAKESLLLYTRILDELRKGK